MPVPPSALSSLCNLRHEILDHRPHMSNVPRLFGYMLEFSTNWQRQSRLTPLTCRRVSCSSIWPRKVTVPCSAFPISGSLGRKIRIATEAARIGGLYKTRWPPCSSSLCHFRREFTVSSWTVVYWNHEPTLVNPRSDSCSCFPDLGPQMRCLMRRWIRKAITVLLIIHRVASKSAFTNNTAKLGRTNMTQGKSTGDNDAFPDGYSTSLVHECTLGWSGAKTN